MVILLLLGRVRRSKTFAEHEYYNSVDRKLYPQTTLLRVSFGNAVDGNACRLLLAARTTAADFRIGER